jgi:simple sugar transport system substrate-binding protein
MKCAREARRQQAPANWCVLQSLEEIMAHRYKVSRRSFLKIATAGTAGALTYSWSAPESAAASELVVGALYVGPKTDYGWNQAHAEGVATLKKSGIKVVEEERVPETIQVAKSMESMIKLDNATLIFATSFGYWDQMLKTAEKYPNVQFLHAAPTVWKEGMPKNAGSYNGYIDEAQYVSGIVAGHASKTGKLGFVGAKPYPASLRNINSFTLGARTVNPKATTQVIFTGDWVLPVKEAEAVNSLADQGIDVVTCHVDSPKVVIETAEKRRIYCCGYHMNQSVLAPKGYLTGAEWNWEKLYADYVQWMREGKAWPHLVRGGLKERIVRNSPYGTAVSEKARKQADAARDKFMSGTFVIYKGPIKDNTGKTVIAAGESHGQTDVWLESMNWLVEGVIGSTTG